MIGRCGNNASGGKVRRQAYVLFRLKTVGIARGDKLSGTLIPPAVKAGVAVFVLGRSGQLHRRALRVHDALRQVPRLVRRDRAVIRSRPDRKLVGCLRLRNGKPDRRGHHRGHQTVRIVINQLRLIGPDGKPDHRMQPAHGDIRLSRRQRSGIAIDRKLEAIRVLPLQREGGLFAAAERPARRAAVAHFDQPIQLAVVRMQGASPQREGVLGIALHRLHAKGVSRPYGGNTARLIQADGELRLRALRRRRHIPEMGVVGAGFVRRGGIAQIATYGPRKPVLPPVAEAIACFRRRRQRDDASLDIGAAAGYRTVCVAVYPRGFIVVIDRDGKIADIAVGQRRRRERKHQRQVQQHCRQLLPSHASFLLFLFPQRVSSAFCIQNAGKGRPLPAKPQKLSSYFYI